MAIDTTSRAYSDNFRALRRFLQGRGVNLRETIVSGVAYDEGDGVSGRITVPGLNSDDRIISVLDMTDLNDATGYLHNAGAKATATIFSVNKGIVFTAKNPGTDGNLIYVKAQASNVDGGLSQPLSVQIGAYDAVLGTTGHPKKTIILVQLATDGAGAALTTAANDALHVAGAIHEAFTNLREPEFVTMAQTGSGVTAWTATGPTALTGGTDFNQGAVQASLNTDMNAEDDSNIRLVAREYGVVGNEISLTVTAGSPTDPAFPTVSVVGTDIEVTVDVSATTGKNVMDAINNDEDASALVVASPAPGSPTGAGLVEAMSIEQLAGGLDSGIQLTVTSSGKKLKVMWLTRSEQPVIG